MQVTLMTKNNLRTIKVGGKVFESGSSEFKYFEDRISDLSPVSTRNFSTGSSSLYIVKGVFPHISNRVSDMIPNGMRSKLYGKFKK